MPSPQPYDRRTQAFRGLCAALGGLWLLAGFFFTAQFFAYQQPGSTPAIPTGPVGHYFVAFAGTTLIGWGGGLLGAAFRPEGGRTVAGLSAFALTLMAVVRIAAWVIGDYHQWLGDVARFEAIFFLVLALGFVWLSPRSTPAGRTAA